MMHVVLLFTTLPYFNFYTEQTHIRALVDYYNNKIKSYKIN